MGKEASRWMEGNGPELSWGGGSEDSEVAVTNQIEGSDCPVEGTGKHRLPFCSENKARHWPRVI